MNEDNDPTMNKKEEKKEEQKPQEPPLLESPIPVKDLVFVTLTTLESKAWAYLGLTAHPETGKPQKDLKQARLAIDAIERLYQVLEPELTGDEKRELQVRLTNLRLNFAKD